MKQAHAIHITKIALTVFILLAAGTGAAALKLETAHARQTDHAHEPSGTAHSEDMPAKDPHAESKPSERHENQSRQAGKHAGEKEKIVHLTAAQIDEFGIRTTSAGSGKIRRHVRMPGEVVADPDRVAHIVPRVPGVTKAVFKKTGDRVKAGQVLAVIESRELADIKAEYLTALKRQDLARADYKREKGLWDRKITSEQEFLDARQAMAEADIRIYSAEQKLLALGFEQSYIDKLADRPDANLTRYEITAPLAGTVIQRHIARGEVVDPASDIFTVARLDTVWVHLTVYQKELGTVSRGQPATVFADKIDAKADGVIDYVSPVVNESTRTATARVILDNPDGRWRPGLFVTGRVGVDVGNVDVVVPKSALQTIGEETVVFAKVDHGFQPVHVQTGKSNAEHVEIVSGLAAGTRIATSRTFMLKSELNSDSIGGHHH